ncbi:MAG: tetratricopeptide repeat protein [Opitutales bacterium]
MNTILSNPHRKDFIALFFIAVSLFFVPLLSANDQAPVGGSSNRVSEAYKLFESGETELALKGFHLALEEDATNLSARLGQAMILLEQQRHQEAFNAYDLVVQEHPGHAFAWNGRGLAAFNLENFEEALNSFKRATSDQPGNGFFYESLAWTHFCRGDYSLAATAAKQATLMYQQNGKTAAYPLLIAYFAQLEEGKQKDARRTLSYAQNNKPAKDAWPTPVFEYLTGRLSAPDLISFVTDTAQETEAHTYIGLHLRSQDEMKEAKPHLDWVASKGDERVFEHTLARSLQTAEKVARLEP